MGLYFEDYNVGQSFISPGRTITETDVVQFAGLTGDFNPLHTDSEFARESGFGQRIAHGLFGISVAMGLMMRLGHFDGTAGAFLGLEWKYLAPVNLGDTIHVHFTVAELRETSSPERGVVVYDVFIHNQREKKVGGGCMTLLFKRK